MVNNYRKRIRREIEELPRSGIELVLHISNYYPSLSLGIGEPNFNTPPHIVRAAIQALEQGKTHYTPDEGLDELREAIAEKTRIENGFAPDPKTEIVVTAGTSPALYGAVQTVINNGDEVIIPTPAYFSYDSIVRIFGGKPVYVPGVEDSYFIPNQNDLAEAVSSKTKLIVICTPNNPTGGVWEKQQLKAALDLAEDYDFLIVADELYEKLVYDGAKNYSVASLPNAHERTITINGLSKSHSMTGFRIGWIIAPPAISTGFCRIHEHSTICASTISQEAALAALKGSQEPVREMVKEYDRRRKMMVERINKSIPMMQVKAPKGGFFVFANVKELIQSRLEDMKRSLKDKGRDLLESFPSRLFSLEDLDVSGSLVSMLYFAHSARIMGVSGSFFGPGGEGYLRLSFAQEYGLIEKALNNMEEILEPWG